MIDNQLRKSSWWTSSLESSFLGGAEFQKSDGFWQCQHDCLCVFKKWYTSNSHENVGKTRLLCATCWPLIVFRFSANNLSNHSNFTWGLLSKFIRILRSTQHILRVSYMLCKPSVQLSRVSDQLRNVSELVNKFLHLLSEESKQLSMVSYLLSKVSV